MSGGHCKKCGRRDVFCICEPLLNDTIAVVGVISILLAFLGLVVFSNSKPKTIEYHHQGYERPEIMGPDPMQDYDQDRADDESDDPDPPYFDGEEPT